MSSSERYVYVHVGMDGWMDGCMYVCTRGCAIKLPEDLRVFGRFRAVSDRFGAIFGRFWAISVAFRPGRTSFGQFRSILERFRTFSGHFGDKSGGRKDYCIGSLVEQPRVHAYTCTCAGSCCLPPLAGGRGARRPRRPLLRAHAGAQ